MGGKSSNANSGCQTEIAEKLLSFSFKTVSWPLVSLSMKKYNGSFEENSGRVFLSEDEYCWLSGKGEGRRSFNSWNFVLCFSII